VRPTLVHEDQPLIAVVSAVDPLLRASASWVNRLCVRVDSAVSSYPPIRRWVNTIAYRYKKLSEKGSSNAPSVNLAGVPGSKRAERRPFGAFYSGSQCSWAASATPTLGKDEEAAATPSKSAQGRRSLRGPIPLHNAVRPRFGHLRDFSDSLALLTS
jgi:hypothetical protein